MDADILRIPVGPGSMHVERYGHGGAPILLIHGFGTCSFLFRDVGPAFAQANRTAFAVDLFGYGESDRPFDAQYGIEAQSEYLDRALTALRLSQATMVGIDLGGAIAMHLAYTRPERVERLVLINAIALDDVPAEDIQTLQRNTGQYALRVSRGTRGPSRVPRNTRGGAADARAARAKRLQAGEHARVAGGKISRTVRGTGRIESPSGSRAIGRQGRHDR